MGVPYHGSHGHHAHSRPSTLLRSGVPRAQARGLHQVLRLQELAVTTNTLSHHTHWVVISSYTPSCSISRLMKTFAGHQSVFIKTVNWYTCSRTIVKFVKWSVFLCIPFKSSVFLLINRVCYISSFWSQAAKINKKEVINECKCSIWAGFQRVQNLVPACRGLSSAMEFGIVGQTLKVTTYKTKYLC